MPSAPVLSVAIPTYNRHVELDRQLTWLHGDLRALRIPWEITVHDNASSDATPEVCRRWQSLLGERLRVHRHPRNIGLIPNIACCIEDARGEWVWTLGDDDVVHDGTAGVVERVLGAEPDLGVLLLNFRGIYPSGEVQQPSYFDPAAAGRFEDGKDGFVHHAERNIGSVIFVSCTVYRRALAVEGLRAWRHSLDNWAFLAFVVGFVASAHPIHVTRDISIDCLVGQSSWQERPGQWTRTAYRDMPQVFLELAALGYPEAFCRTLSLRFLWEAQVTWSSVREHVRAVRRCPGFLTLLPRAALLEGAAGVPAA